MIFVRENVRYNYALTTANWESLDLACRRIAATLEFDREKGKQ